MRRCEWITSPPSKRRKRCLPWASTASIACPASFSGQRCSPKRGWGVASSSGTRPSSTGRIRWAAWWMVSPSGIVRPEGTPRASASGGAREAAQALALGLHLRPGAEALEPVGDAGELDDEPLALGGHGDGRALGARAQAPHERREHGAQQLADEDDAQDLEVERLVAVLGEQPGDRRD